MDAAHDDGSPGQRGALWILIAAACIVAALNGWRYATYLLDDTFISFRYAKNLVDGHGLVFNPGEYVEGYTNFLFVMLAALWLRLGIDPVAASKCVVATMALLTLVATSRLATRGPRGKASARASVLAPLLLLPLPAFIYWSLSAFETTMFTGLLLIAVWLLMRQSETGRYRGAGVVFVLLALTRPEGVVLFAVSIAAVAAEAWLRTGRVRLRSHLLDVAVFVLLYGTYFAWRYSYYHELVPNTFRAKVTGGWEQAMTGLVYAKDWSLTFPFLAATLLAPLALLAPRWRHAITPTPTMVVLYLVALSYVAYVVAIGGDFMPFHRFFVPLLPLVCIFLAWALDGFGRWGRLVLAIALLHIACSHLNDEPYRAFVAHRTALVGEWVGERMAAALAPADLIAVNTAGSLPYRSGLPAVDMLGLTDPEIAKRPVFIVSPGWAGHRRGWGAYVLDRRPRVIFFYNSSGSREPFYLSDHELADNPYFRFFYRLKLETLPIHDGGAGAVGRFLGFPYGFAPSGQSPWPDLGLRAEFRQSLVPHTVLFEGPTQVNYFEFDARDGDLWGLRQPDLAGFITAVSQRWAASLRPNDYDLAARAEVERLCSEAYEKIQAGDRESAKRLLTAAVRDNDRAKLPLVYQYVANVAVLDGDLFTAVAAQKEALRLAPENVLYQNNLKSILQMPYRQATERSAG